MKMRFSKIPRLFLVLGLVGLVVLIFSLGLWSSYLIKGKDEKKVAESVVQKDKYIEFVDEVYDKIKENYWEKITDEELATLFVQGTEKLVNQPQNLTEKNKNGVEKMVSEALKEVDPNKKIEFISGLSDIVLAILKPFGRSRLYAQKDEKQLSNTVNNVNPGVNHFDELGVKKDATTAQIEQAYKEQTKKATTSAEKVVVEQAYNILKNEDSRKIYEVSGVEPTIEYKLLAPDIYYVHLTKFSPTSLDEFQRVMVKVDNRVGLNSLIFDLRDNIGGAIDQLPYFLGPFIGPDSLAYQFYHQGEKIDFKTKSGWLASMVIYKKVVILINEGSQSSAEVMAAALKKYNVGVVVGTTTKGWGTVERVFPLEKQIDETQKFSVFMVHSVTLRDDSQPIEGRGVDPMISTKDKNWKAQLLEHFNYQPLIDAVASVVEGKV